MLAANGQETRRADEQRNVEVRRHDEAREAGFDDAEAWIFAINGEDIGRLRKLLADGCPPELAARILI